MPDRSAALNHVFRALGDPTRRAVLVALRQGPASTTALAAAFDMTLPSFTQHLHALEASGLVHSRKSGRVRTWRLSPRPLIAAAHWIDRQRAEWEERLDRLDAVLYDMKEKR